MRTGVRPMIRVAEHGGSRAGRKPHTLRLRYNAAAQIRDGRLTCRSPPLDHCCHCPLPPVLPLSLLDPLLPLW